MKLLVKQKLDKEFLNSSGQMTFFVQCKERAVDTDPTSQKGEVMWTPPQKTFRDPSALNKFYVSPCFQIFVFSPHHRFQWSIPGLVLTWSHDNPGSMLTSERPQVPKDL